MNRTRRVAASSYPAYEQPGQQTTRASAVPPGNKPLSVHQFNLLPLRVCHHILIRTAVAHDGIKTGQLAHSGRAHFAYLAVIHHQHMVLSHAHRPLFYRQFIQIKAGCALTDMHTRRGVKGDIRAEIIKRVLQIERFENGIAGVELAAAEDHPATRFFLQGEERIQGVADAGKGQVRG